MRSELLASPASRYSTLPPFLPLPTTPDDSLLRSRSPDSPRLFNKRPIPRPSPICTLDGRGHHRAAIGNPEPPWLVLPPPAPKNPFSRDPPLPDLQVKGTGTEIPFSMRLVQMKKRLATDSTTTTPEGPALESAAGKAVSALAFMIGELQRSVFEEEVLEKVSKDRSGSFVWLFRSVFSTSPDLVVQLLVLLARFLIFSAGNTMKSYSVSSELQVKVAGDPPGGDIGHLPSIRDFGNWSGIGIKEGTADMEDDDKCMDRRRRMYDWNIAMGDVNSLILSNYAQFLYRIANDHDRADEYFQRAVVAEPRDAEALSRYAFFLWEVRGDINAAEEMFLEAMDADPGNHYHISNYAWFLYGTGASDTCYPLDPPLLPEV